MIADGLHSDCLYQRTAAGVLMPGCPHESLQQRQRVRDMSPLPPGGGAVPGFEFFDPWAQLEQRLLLPNSSWLAAVQQVRLQSLSTYTAASPKCHCFFFHAQLLCRTMACTHSICSHRWARTIGDASREFILWHAVSAGAEATCSMASTCNRPAIPWAASKSNICGRREPASRRGSRYAGYTLTSGPGRPAAVAAGVGAAPHPHPSKPEVVQPKPARGGHRSGCGFGFAHVCRNCSCLAVAETRPSRRMQGQVKSPE